MRDLTKSIGSFSWGMTLFGLRQMVNVLRPSEATRSFDSVTDATERQLGDVLKSTFRAGDNLQRGMVDMTFGLFSLDMLDPNRWARMASDAMGCATGAADASGTAGRGPAPGPGQGPGQGSAQGGGWGPMPPPSGGGGTGGREPTPKPQG